MFSLIILMYLAGSMMAFDTTIENYTVPISGKCVLTCYIAEIRSFKVLWQRIDRSNHHDERDQLTLIAFDGVVYSNKDHYRLESDYVGSYNLIIDRVNEDDQGEYQCQINTEPRRTKRIFLTVQVPPRIIEFRPNPSLLAVRSGTSLTFFCRAEGTPSPRIRWRIRDNEQSQNDLIPPENSNIWFVPSVGRSFPRNVECIADNGVLPASNRIFTIHTEYAPIVTVKNDFVSVDGKKNLTLECKVSSRPLSRISWLKNGEDLLEDRFAQTRVNQSSLISRYQLQINSVDDFGQYTCLAVNKHGQAEGKTFVLEESTTSTSFSLASIELKTSQLLNKLDLTLTSRSHRAIFSLKLLLLLAFVGF